MDIKKITKGAKLKTIPDIIVVWRAGGKVEGVRVGKGKILTCGQDQNHGSEIEIRVDGYPYLCHAEKEFLAKNTALA